MTSDKGRSSDPLDERLVEARDEILGDAENVLAQEMGDQGQAIVLTESRVTILKAGLAATGTLDGRKSASYDLDRITAVNVRKGPMGAVIQICAGEQEPAHAGPPDNVIVFSGDKRVRKCDAIAANIEKALGTPAHNTESGANDSREPTTEPQPLVEEHASAEPQPVEENAPEVPKGGREPTSLADEIYAELVEAQADPAE